jgi:hypothetical protein
MLHDAWPSFAAVAGKVIMLDRQVSGQPARKTKEIRRRITQEGSILSRRAPNYNELLALRRIALSPVGLSVSTDFA